MIIKSIKLVNFRCHKKYDLVCDDNITKILGDNGCGKTSVLEAIYEALKGKSFRASDKDIVKRDSDGYKVKLEYCNGEIVIVKYDGNKKRFELGDKKYYRLPKDKKYPVVLFEPKDLNLVGASPSRKRDYFDVMFANLNEKYNQSLTRYNKALRQRNELLKKDNLKRNELFSWNVMLTKYGCEILNQRIKIIELINQRITNVYREIAENDDRVEIMYKNEICNESEYMKRLEDGFERDHLIGCTEFGVHRDDYLFIFNNNLADGSASRGEVRSIVIAVKFIEAEMIKDLTNKQPIILLDDVFSELDDKRQKCLVGNFRDNQIILTSVK